MSQIYYLTEEEVALIRDKAGIDLEAREDAFLTKEYMKSEFRLAIELLGDEEMEEKISKDFDEHFEAFWEMYYNSPSKRNGTKVIVDALDEIFDVIREHIYDLSEKL